MKIKFIKTKEIVVDIPEEQFMNAVLNDSVEYDFNSYLSSMETTELFAEDDKTGGLLWLADY